MTEAHDLRVSFIAQKRKLAFNCGKNTNAAHLPRIRDNVLMANISLLEQAEIINRAHALDPSVQYHSPLWEGCIIQRWRGFLGEYQTPPLSYPIIAIISAGRAKIKRKGENAQLSADQAMPGDVALIPRGKAMAWHVNGEMDVITVTFASDAICNQLQDIYEHIADKVDGTKYVGSFTNSYLFTNANHISNVILSQESNRGEYIESHLHAMGLYVTHYLGKKDDGLTEFQLHSHIVNYTIQRLSLGISNKINIEDIASELRLSPALLTKKFKQEMGVTPHNFLLLKRIQKAQSLLVNTDLDIASIAVDCGFSHQSHLTRNFTKITKVSPHKYRQQSHKELKLK